MREVMCRKLSAGSPFQVGYPPSGYAHPWTPPAWPTWPELNSAVNLFLRREGTSVLHWVPRPIERILVWDRVSGPLTGMLAVIRGPFAKEVYWEDPLSLFT